MGAKQLKEIKRMRELTIFSVIIMMLIFLSITSTIRDVLGFTSDIIVVPDDYPSVQSAINNAEPGYTIIVKSGIYYENIIVNKEIALEGIDSGGGRPLINGEVLIKADNVKFKGFTVMHGDTGILINGSMGCVITDNFIAYNRFGIYLNMSRNCLIANNTLYQNPWAGIFIERSRDNSIINNNVSDGFNGIYIKSSNTTKISGNLIENIAFNGIMLDSIEYGPARNNTIVNNVLRNTKMLLETIEPSYSEITNNTFVNGGIMIWDWSFKNFNNMVRNNTVNGKPLILLNNVAGIKIDYAGQVILINCRDIIVENLDLSHTAVGIQLLNTSNTRLENNILSNNSVGIELDFSSNNIIRNNIVSNSYDFGVSLAWDSNNNVITDNKIEGMSKYGGLYLHASNNNELRSNIIVNNDIGIYLHFFSNNNTVYKNYVAYNKLGIKVFESSWNIVYKNIFMENDIGVNITDAGSVNNVFYLNDFMNKVNAYSSSHETNLWFSKQNVTYSYNGRIYTSPLGNYWSDYIGTDMNEDGVGDNPYDKGNVSDPYPLLSHVSSYNILPKAFFTYSPIVHYVESLIIFNASGSYDLDGEIKQYLWDFGDGTKGSGRIAFHSYNKPGRYYVKLTVVDDRGLKDTVSREISIMELPTKTETKTVILTTTTVERTVVTSKEMTTVTTAIPTTINVERTVVTPSPTTLITTSVVTSREITTVTTTDWNTTGVVSVILLVLGLAIGYMIRRK